MSEQDRDRVKEIATQLLIAAGENVKNGSVTLHFNHEGKLAGMKVEKHQKF